MRCLLDTHTALWMITDAPDLSASARAVIATEQNDIYLSVASLWEIVIKSSLGKPPVGDIKAIEAVLRRESVTILPITTGALVSLSQLPFHHKDPFDRMIIATAVSEGLTILTVDPVFPLYEVSLSW